MKTLARLLSVLLSMWEQYQAERKADKRARELDALRKEPVNWYRNHFDGMRDVPAKNDDADQAGAKPD
jgi:hypothetical protein